MRNGLQLEKIKEYVNSSFTRKIGRWVLHTMIVCLFAFVIVVYFGQGVKATDCGMEPEIRKGDVVFINKMVYDISKPKRGDIIAFKPNGDDTSGSNIKRIVGLPGETIRIQNGKICINGKELKESYGTTMIENAGVAEEEIVLSGDEYFVLGDDRNDGEDSRMANIGNVKRDDIEGKVWFVLSWGKNFGFI